MPYFAYQNCTRGTRRLSGHDIFVMSLMVSLPAIGLDLLLRTPAASFPAQSGPAVQNWITDSLMAVPFFFAGVWMGDLVASRAGLGMVKRSDLVKRSLVIALLSSLAIAPVWFVVSEIDNPVTAQPLVSPHAHDSGAVYSVPAGVVIALVCVCLVPAAFWAGRAIARHAPAARTRALPVTRIAVPLLLAVAVPVLAWLLYRAADHAYASQVYYDGGAPVAVRNAASAHTAAHVTAAPFALAYQVAHAVQDGLAGQAAGLPAGALALLLMRRRGPVTEAPATEDPATDGAPRETAPSTSSRPGPVGAPADRPTTTATEEATR